MTDSHPLAVCGATAADVDFIAHARYDMAVLLEAIAGAQRGAYS